MAYRTLYRKYRPTAFRDVVGQEAIVKTLANQIKEGRISHAYLFCGTHGTGKTTVAKIFARAVNCMDPADGEPCNKCEICQSILRGASVNVVEIDAASNNGVDNIRDIIEDVSYRPTSGRYRVYIIDEVHMLSKGAYNALLKTLEEPPEYVIFILATTEVGKIPDTILSRCQRYDFRRIADNEVYDHLEAICRMENVDADPAALEYIAGISEGSMRDALSLLDKCVSTFSSGFTYDDLAGILGVVDKSVFADITESIAEGDTARVIGLFNSQIMSGKDPVQFMTDYLYILRDMMMISLGTDPDSDFRRFADGTRIRSAALKAGTDNIIRYIRSVSKALADVKRSDASRVLCEICLIELSRPETGRDTESLISRIELLEKKVASGFVIKEESSDGRSPEDTVEIIPDVTDISDIPDLAGFEISEEYSVPKEDFSGNTEVSLNWNDVISEISSPLTRSIMKFSRVSVVSGVFNVYIENDMARDMISREDLESELQRIIYRKYGYDNPVRIAFEDENISKGPDLDTVIREKINMDIIEE